MWLVIFKEGRTQLTSLRLELELVSEPRKKSFVIKSIHIDCIKSLHIDMSFIHSLLDFIHSFGTQCKLVFTTEEILHDSPQTAWVNIFPSIKQMLNVALLTSHNLFVCVSWRMWCEKHISSAESIENRIITYENYQTILTTQELYLSAI